MPIFDVSVVSDQSAAAKCSASAGRRAVHVTFAPAGVGRVAFGGVLRESVPGAAPTLADQVQTDSHAANGEQDHPTGDGVDRQADDVQCRG